MAPLPGDRLEIRTLERVTVSLTPTYSGCPATEAIEASVVAALPFTE